MIKKVMIQDDLGILCSGLAIVDLDGSDVCIDFDVVKPPQTNVIVGGRKKRISMEDADQFERELFELFTFHNIPLKIGTYAISEEINQSNRRVEIEMKQLTTKRVCLLVNLGGFEKRMSENLLIAKTYGEFVYSLTGDGLVDINKAQLVPVNITALTPAELQVWSSMINDQLIEAGFDPDNTIMLAAGRNYRGTLPLGMNIGNNVRIGA
ncbi:hypothetical protein ACDZ28_00950 (plasmid) [Paenibacillus sp. RS8]|jgi:hypothetical protein|uniref:hypothetical protein n=1 Tax=Paenibacillus sp. RS8 TaxID=3242681 RepID=UPI0035C0BB4B